MKKKFLTLITAGICIFSSISSFAQTSETIKPFEILNYGIYDYNLNNEIDYLYCQTSNPYQYYYITDKNLINEIMQYIGNIDMSFDYEANKLGPRQINRFYIDLYHISQKYSGSIYDEDKAISFYDKISTIKLNEDDITLGKDNLIFSIDENIVDKLDELVQKGQKVDFVDSSEDIDVSKLIMILDNKKIDFSNNKPFQVDIRKSNKALMVPVENIIKNFEGASCLWNDETKTFTLNTKVKSDERSEDDYTLTIKEGQTKYNLVNVSKINGFDDYTKNEERELKTSIEVINGVVYMSLEDLAEFLPCNIHYHPFDNIVIAVTR